MIKPRARRGFCLSGEGFCPLRDKAVCWHHPEGPGPAVAYCPLPVSPIGGSIGLDAASIWGISVNTPAVIEEGGFGASVAAPVVARIFEGISGNANAATVQVRPPDIQD